MHALELAELATVFARFSPGLLAGRIVPPRPAQQQYWLQAKFRHEFWSGRLANHRQEIQTGGVTHRRQSWQKIIPIIEDVLLSEPLTRCLAYHAGLLAEKLIDPDFSTLANSALASHIEARHRCLHLLVFGEGLSVEYSVKLNRLRREMEYINDTILTSMEQLHAQQSVCFDEFWTQHQRQASPTPSVTEQVNTRLLQLECIRLTIRPSVTQHLSASLPCTPANQQVAGAVLNLLPATAFDSLGLPTSALQSRLAAQSSEATLGSQLFTPLSSTSIAHYLVSHRPASTGPTTSNSRWK